MTSATTKPTQLIRLLKPLYNICPKNNTNIIIHMSIGLFPLFKFIDRNEKMFW